MIDRIEYVDANGNPIWTSDIEYWEEFIGYETESGEVIMYDYEV